MTKEEIRKIFEETLERLPDVDIAHASIVFYKNGYYHDCQYVDKEANEYRDEFEQYDLKGNRETRRIETRSFKEG